MKTHNFKPFENAANHTETPKGIREVSHLHRLDESRHMATALYIARLSNQILDKTPHDSRLCLKTASDPLGPKTECRIPRPLLDKCTLCPHIQFHSKRRSKRLIGPHQNHTAASLTKLHPRQTRLTQANKRIVEQSGLSPK